MTARPLTALAVSVMLHAGLVAAMILLSTRDVGLQALMIDLTVPDRVASPAPPAAGDRDRSAAAARPAAPPMPRSGTSATPRRAAGAAARPPAGARSSPAAPGPAAPPPASAPSPAPSPPSPAAADAPSPGSPALAAEEVAPPAAPPAPGAGASGSDRVAGRVGGAGEDRSPGRGSGGSRDAIGAASIGSGYGTGSAAGARAAGDGAGEYGAYLARFRERIQQPLRYPAAARRRGLAGVVHVDVVILPSGAVGPVAVARSSSHAVLDEEAVRTVRTLPALPFPAEVTPRTLRVRLPVVFTLE